MIPGFEQTEKQLDALTVRGDLISRKAAIEAIKKDMYADKDYMSAIICDGIEDVLNSLPTAETERKRGKWIYEKEMQCSCCGFICDDPYYLGAANYCPNCGAKMEAKE